MRKGRRRIFVIGSANLDLMIRVDRFPLSGETLAGSDMELHAGGKGANQACAAARLGGEVYFVGCVGRDDFGDRLRSSLHAAGTNVSYVRSSRERPTGCASIYVAPEGQNTIVTSPGANAEVSEEDVGSALTGLTSDDLLLLQLEIPFETVRFALLTAREAGATTILDPAPARELDRAFLNLVSILTPNQTEATVVLAGRNDSCREALAPRLAEELVERGAACALLKLGEDGCGIQAGAGFTRIPGFRVQATDTTAAGDVFNGALAVSLAEGAALPQAARFANAAAAISVTRAGAQSSVPSREEVDAFLLRAEDHECS